MIWKLKEELFQGDGKLRILFGTCIFEISFKGGGSDGNESACNAGELGLIPESGRSLE